MPCFVLPPSACAAAKQKNKSNELLRFLLRKEAMASKMKHFCYARLPAQLR
jgi:hypothetical protein